MTFEIRHDRAQLKRHHSVDPKIATKDTLLLMVMTEEQTRMFEVTYEVDNPECDTPAQLAQALRAMADKVEELA